MALDLNPLTRTVPVPENFAMRTDYNIAGVTVRRLSPNKLEQCGWAFYDAINTNVLQKLHEIRALTQEVEKSDDKIADMIKTLPEEQRAQALREYLEKKQIDDPEDKEEKTVDPADKKPEDRTDEEVIGPMSKFQLIRYGLVRVNAEKKPAEDVLAVLEPEEMTWLAARVVRWTDRQYRNLPGEEGNVSEPSSQAVS